MQKKVSEAIANSLNAISKFKNAKGQITSWFDYIIIIIVGWAVSSLETDIGSTSLYMMTISAETSN